jgi:hypothetical protein
MSEIEVLRRLRDEVPDDLPVSRAETALRTAIRADAGAAPAGHGKRRVRLVIAGGISFVAAAAVAMTAGIVSNGGPHPVGQLTVRELAYRAAAAASRQPDVPAGHWVYWREQDGHGPKAHRWQVWTTADGKKAAYRYLGKVYRVSVQPARSRPGDQYIGQPEITLIKPPEGGITIGTQSGYMAVRFADLGKLPGDPRALVRYLGHLRVPKGGPPPARAFGIVVDLLQTYVMSPQLTAELYRALADIPGVTIDRHAVDVAGRPGVGFAFDVIPGSGDKQELVINPHTYRLMAVQLVRDKRGPDGHRVFDGGTAILRTELVKGPGVLPGA